MDAAEIALHLAVAIPLTLSKARDMMFSPAGGN